MSGVWIDGNTFVEIKETEFILFDSKARIIRRERKKVAEVFSNIPTSGKGFIKMCAWFKEDNRLKRMTVTCLSSNCAGCNVRLFIKHKLARLL